MIALSDITPEDLINLDLGIFDLQLLLHLGPGNTSGTLRFLVLWRRKFLFLEISGQALIPTYIPDDDQLQK